MVARLTAVAHDVGFWFVAVNETSVEPGTAEATSSEPVDLRDVSDWIRAR